MTKQIFLFITLFFTLGYANAQKGSASPYSFFGIGEESIIKTVEEISMGETGVANFSNHQIFLSNPASLARLRYTTYDLGVSTKVIKVNNGTISEKSSASSLSYMILGVPLGDNAAFSFGLQPNTNIGYSLLQEFKNSSDVVDEVNLFSGSGGTNRLFLGYGRKINKFASIGLEGSFVFGNLSNTILNRRLDAVLASQFESNSNVSGFNLKAGMQYQIPVKNKKGVEIRLGATASLGSNYTNRGSELLFSFINGSSGSVIAKDTISNVAFSGTIKSPFKSTVGVGIGKAYNWNVSVEYAYQNALSFVGGAPNAGNVNYTSANRFSLGGYYLPNMNSITSYWDRVIYRGGLKYKQSGLNVNNNNVNEFGISFGLGLPMSKELSTFNLGLELGKRGTISNGLVKENYFNIRIGLTLNDKWFRKRKIL